jgi:hypothetical protein
VQTAFLSVRQKRNAKELAGEGLAHQSRFFMPRKSQEKSSQFRTNLTTRINDKVGIHAMQERKTTDNKQ